MNWLINLLKYAMLAMGAKTNGTEKSFNVDLTFVRTVFLLFCSAVGIAFAVGSGAPAIQGLLPRVAVLEQEQINTKKEIVDFKASTQTSNAVINSKLDMLLSQLADLQRAQYARADRK